MSVEGETLMLFDAPTKGQSGAIVVNRQKRPFVGITGDATTLMDPDGRRVQVELASDHISFGAHSSACDAWIDNFDEGPDGTLDFRTLDFANGVKKTELSFSERWLELVKRDEETGVTVDGAFMSLDEARSKFGDSTLNRTQR